MLKELVSKFHTMFEYWKKYLRKGLMCYKYIDSQDKYNETSLPNEKSLPLS